MSAIDEMERGKLCRMAGRAYYNLQAWRNGRNEVRYIREDERLAVEQAIAGYELFKRLADQYAEEIIRQTRKEHRKRYPPSKKAKTRPQTPPK